MIQHPFTIKIVDEFISDNKHCIVMEQVNRGSMDKVLKIRKESNQTYQEDVILRIFANLCLALYEIHSKGVQHRDLKPENILIHNYNGLDIYKITDFGICKYDKSTLKLDTTTGITGTMSYVSPERIKGNPNSDKEDIWALGVVMYYLATFDFPFKGEESASKMHAIIE